jgi:hypothetical protein
VSDTMKRNQSCEPRSASRQSEPRRHIIILCLMFLQSNYIANGFFAM